MLPLILGLSGPDLTNDERAFLREAAPAGFILFGRNVADPAQLRALTDELRSLTGRDDLPILIDQEGGRVARLQPPHWPAFPAQAQFGELYAHAPISGLEAARANAAAIGAVLAATGINVTCLPLLDLQHEGAHSIIGDRAFGGEPMAVASLGRAVLDGLAEAGVAGVIKHMPGQGRASADSHAELPTVEADIGMGALSGPLAERGRAALAAGCDLVLHCSGVLAEAEELAAALPAIGEAAAARMAHIFDGVGTETAPLEALLAKRDALLGLVQTA